MFPHRVLSGSNSPLSSFVEGFLNGVFVDPAKIGPELLKVNQMWQGGCNPEQRGPIHGDQ